jgi:NitT/TauT family transport system substrate-binding protein
VSSELVDEPDHDQSKSRKGNPMGIKVKGIRAIGAAVLAIAAVVLLAGCGDDDSTEGTSAEGATTEVAIGTQPWIGYGPMWIAEDQGFDEDHGVDLKLVNFGSRQDLESGFASGKFQGANSATNDLIRLADLDVDYKAVLMEDFSLAADAIVTCNPDIQSLEDVEGATVGFEEFSVSDVLFRYAIQEAGVDFDSVDYVPMPPAEAGTAVAAGRVDVAATYEPYLQSALDTGENCEILYTAEERPGLISDALAVSTEFAESDPDAVVGVLQAWNDAVDFYNSNPDEAQAIIAKAVGEKPEALKPTFDGIRLFDLEESQDFLENDYEALWGDIASILAEQGQIESEPDPADFIDTSFGDQALGE